MSKVAKKKKGGGADPLALKKKLKSTQVGTARRAQRA